MTLMVPQRQIVTPRGVVPVPVVDPNTIPVVFSEENEWKEETYKQLGDLDDLELLYNDVLVLKYKRTHLSANIVASAETEREDRWQGSVGLVLKVGPRAFQDDEHTKFYGLSVKRGDWVMYRNTDGWDRGVQQLFGYHQFAECRLIADAHIRAKLRYPARFVPTA